VAIRISQKQLTLTTKFFYERRKEMKVLTSLLVVSLFVLSGFAQASVCPGTNVIEDPAEFQWTNNEGTLEIGEASFVIGGETLTTRAYKQEGENFSFSIPGPTMRMTPGQTYVLTFKNTLPFAVPSTDHNTLKDPNITNIHTHGLHVSGETPGDDVTRLINGGYCGDYVYDLGLDHMGGTLWYHAHHHGSTWLQVAGGAFGMLIIDDSNDGIPAGVANMTERLLAVGFLEPGRVAGNGGDTLISGTLTSAWTANGKVEGNLCTPVGEWQHWRLLIADPDAKMKTVEIGPECEAVLMARDGVWRTTAPLALVDNEIELTGASRADLAVRCSADSTLTVDRNVVANIFADPNLQADLTVGPYSGGASGGTWQANRPSYLRDLSNETVDYTDSISVGARSVYGQSFDADIPIFDLLPGVQEWSIGANNHPFHLHVYHQQVQGACSGGAFEDGEYYDTISGSCDIRFDTDPVTTTAYDGRTIMHCHILQHEDNGAMGWANATLGGLPAPTLPPGKQVLYECGGGQCTDNDVDGYGNPGDASCPNGAATDCDDNDFAVNPGATEGPFGDPNCGDNKDNDCDGLTDGNDPDCQETNCSDIMDRNTCRNTPGCEWQGSKNNGMCVDAPTGQCIDNDQDGYGNPGDASCPNGAATDCDDNDFAVNPGATEGPVGDPTCGDNKDNDCDGLTDGNDPDCQQVCSDITMKNVCNNTPGCMWDKPTKTCVDVP
jgi:FtsP/CotA-like multicopper oxidase with cupredoxin domain